jgi:hypothetical protein
MGKVSENMIKGTTKKKSKKDVCHYAIVLEVMFQKWFQLKRSIAIGEEEIGKVAIRRQKKKRHFEGEILEKQKTFEPYAHFS